MTMVTGMSTKAVSLATFMGQITAASPRIIKMFRILLPTTFPMVMSALPWNAAVRLTAASGALVPKATMVSPITSWGIPNFSAMLAAPSTNQSAPFTKSTNPTANKASCIIISMENSLSYPFILCF